MISVASCWWALLADRELRFIYLSQPEPGSLSFHSLLDTSLFVHLHSEEFQAAQLDFTQSFHQNSLLGSVTTCRFKLPSSSSSLPPPGSHLGSNPGPEPHWYMVVEISLFGISDRLSIGLFHILDTGAPFLKSCCSQFILNDQELDMIERAVDNIETKAEYLEESSAAARLTRDSQTRFIQIYDFNEGETSSLVNSAQIACFPSSNYLRSTLQAPFPRYTRDWNSPLYFSEDLSDFSISLQRCRRVTGYRHWGSPKKSASLRLRIPLPPPPSTFSKASTVSLQHQYLIQQHQHQQPQHQQAQQKMDQFIPGMMNTVAFFWGRYLFCVKQILTFTHIPPPPPPLPSNMALITSPFFQHLTHYPSFAASSSSSSSSSSFAAAAAAGGGAGGASSGGVERAGACNIAGVASGGKGEKDFSIILYSGIRDWSHCSTSTAAAGGGGGGGVQVVVGGGGGGGSVIERGEATSKKRVFHDQKEKKASKDDRFSTLDMPIPQSKKSFTSGTPGPGVKGSTAPAKDAIINSSSTSTVKKCERCGTNHSPEWRRGPSGHKTLCNACGLRYARSLAKAAGKLGSRLDSFPPRMGVYYTTHQQQQPLELGLPGLLDLKTEQQQQQQQQQSKNTTEEPPLPVLVGQLKTTSASEFGYWKSVYHHHHHHHPLLTSDKS